MVDHRSALRAFVEAFVLAVVSLVDALMTDDMLAQSQPPPAGAGIASFSASTPFAFFDIPAVPICSPSINFRFYPIHGCDIPQVMYPEAEPGRGRR